MKTQEVFSSKSEQKISKNNHQFIYHLKNLCETIEKQISSILEMMHPDKIPQLTQKSIEKHLLNLKQSIIRAITARLPQVMTTEEKYKNLIVELNEDREQLRAKNKELLAKYQAQVLENDRLKIEAIQFNENYQTSANGYESMHSKNEQLKLEIQYLNNKIKQYSNKQVQGSNQQSKAQESQINYKNQIKQLKQALDCYSQEKMLYRRELMDLQKIVSEQKNMIKCENTKNQEMLHDLQALEHLLHNQRQNSALLKDELHKQIIEKQKMRDDIERSQKIIEKKQEEIRQNQNYISAQRKKNIQQKSHYLKENEDLRNSIKQLETKYNSKQIQYAKIQSKMKERAVEDTNVKEIIMQIKGDFDKKIQAISKNKEDLERKFQQKFKIMKKKQSQILQKNNNLKNENQRLYEAMNQYAKEELKMQKKYQKIVVEKEKIEKLMRANHEKNRQKMMKIKINISRYLKPQFLQLKSSLSEIKFNTKQELTQFKDFSYSSYKQINHKINQQTAKKIEQIRQMEFNTKYISELEKKLLTTSEESNKIVSNFIETQQSWNQRNAAKDKRILELEEQLEKQKGKYAHSLQNLNRIMQKYSGQSSQNKYRQPKVICEEDQSSSNQKYSLISEQYRPYQDLCNQSLDHQIRAQKNRFDALQVEYRGLLRY